MGFFLCTQCGSVIGLSHSSQNYPAFSYSTDAFMQIAFIARSTLYAVQGGDTFQVIQTARHLRKLGIRVDVKLTHEKIDDERYDLLHFFNIIRPADMLCIIRKGEKLLFFPPR